MGTRFHVFGICHTIENEFPKLFSHLTHSAKPPASHQLHFIFT